MESSAAPTKVMPSAQLFLEARAVIGESPALDRRSGKLLWVDIGSGSVLETDLSTKSTTATALPTIIGSISPRAQPEGFAVGVSDGFGLVVDGALTVLDRCLPEDYKRMNDAKVDSRGRLWAGSTGIGVHGNDRSDEASPTVRRTGKKHADYFGIGSLHRWDGGSPSREMAHGFVLPNGLGWNVQDDTMFLADSYTHQLLAAPFEAESGLVGEFDVIAEIDDGSPDGLAVDVDGYLWVAIWGAGEIRRYGSDGRLHSVLPVPVSQPASCAFGPDGTLFITTARDGLSAEALTLEPLAGSIFTAPTHTSGVPVTPFMA